MRVKRERESDTVEDYANFREKDSEEREEKDR